MKASWASVVALCCGCAGAAPAPVADDAQASRRLQQVRAQHAALLTRLHDVPAEQLARCKLSADDCSLQVAERRGRLASSYGLSRCADAPDGDAKSSCVVTQLAGQGHERELAEFFALENWCKTKLLACTAELAAETRLAGAEKRFEQRQQLLEGSPAAAAARGAVEAQRAQLEYLRSSLPPGASAICPAQAQRDECQQRVALASTQLQERLRQDSYAPATAAAEYEAIKGLEASCWAPELACLSSARPQYGVFPESRKWLERNLDLLKQRQQLAAVVDEQQADACIHGLETAHQAEIVAAYVPYVREPVIYFRMQLDKAFLSLHQAQVACLAAKRKPATATHVVTAAR